MCTIVSLEAATSLGEEATSFASPKSSTLMKPSGRMTTFSGLMSR